MLPSQGRDFGSLSSFTGRGLLLEVIRPRGWGNQVLVGRSLADVACSNPFSRAPFRKRVKAATDRDSLPHTTLAEFRRCRVCGTERIEVQPAAERGRRDADDEGAPLRRDQGRPRSGVGNFLKIPYLAICYSSYKSLLENLQKVFC